MELERELKGAREKPQERGSQVNEWRKQCETMQKAIAERMAKKRRAAQGATPGEGAGAAAGSDEVPNGVSSSGASGGAAPA
eukprot:1763507-Pyramimonas_sp.AAC.1